MIQAPGVMWYEKLWRNQIAGAETGSKHRAGRTPVISAPPFRFVDWSRRREDTPDTPAPLADKAAERLRCLLALGQLCSCERPAASPAHRAYSPLRHQPHPAAQPRPAREPWRKQSRTAALPSAAAREPPAYVFRGVKIFHMHILGQSSGQPRAEILLNSGVGVRQTNHAEACPEVAK